MRDTIDRRDFLKLAGLGGAVFASGLAGCAEMAGTAQDDFYFVQLSDTHFTGLPSGSDRSPRAFRYDTGRPKPSRATMLLIIQGADVETTVLKEIAKLSGASRIEQIRPQTFRLHDVRSADGIAELCARQKLDWAFVPEDPNSPLSGCP
jgi:hypothetical protein